VGVQVEFVEQFDSRDVDEDLADKRTVFTADCVKRDPIRRQEDFAGWPGR
jgi:hypothetical protein